MFLPRNGFVNMSTLHPINPSTDCWLLFIVAMQYRKCFWLRWLFNISVMQTWGFSTEIGSAVRLYWDRYARPSLTLPWRETSMQLTRDFQIVGARSLGLWPLHLESPLAFRYEGQFQFLCIDTVRFKHQENLLLVFFCNTILNSVDHRWKEMCQIVSHRGM